MKIPVFEEIILENEEIDFIREKIIDSKIGKVPTYINLGDRKKEDKINLLINLKNIFLSENLNPRFPYPCYVITERLLEDYFPQSPSVKELPDHFFKKVKRPNNKEVQLLNKLGLKVEKIKNLEMNRIMENIKDTSLSQRKLFQNTKELYFYEILHYKLFERDKEKVKNGKKV